MSTSSIARNQKSLLAALMVGVFLSPINVTFTGIALPTMQAHYGINVEQLSWVASAYFIPTVVFMPLMSAVAQRWGLRRIYKLGLTLLGLSAFATALAPNFSWLLIGRVLQGVGWSSLYPVALILIHSNFPADKRGEAVGMWESSVGVAAIIGPALGGLLVQYLGWQSIYFTIGSLAFLGALLSVKSIPEGKRSETGSSKFDFVGAVSMTGALLLLLLGITLKSFSLFGAGLITGIIWLRSAHENSHPFIDLAILTNRRFLSAAGAANLRMIIGVSAIISLPLFLEGVQNLSPTAVGLLLPAYSLFLFIGARPGGRWADRAGSRQPAVSGFVLMTLGSAMLILLDVTSGLFLIISALAIRGIGAGISQAPFAKEATSALGSEHASMAAGLYGMIRYSGLALGSALVGILLNNRFVFYNSSGTGLSALPAFRELFTVLALVGVLGTGLSWLIGSKQSSPVQLAPASGKVIEG